MPLDYKKRATLLSLGFFLLAASPIQAGTLKVMLTGRANNSMFSKLIQEYQKTHKQTKITPIYMDWQDVASAIAKKPDVFIGSNYFLSDNLDIGLFEDLNKLLPAPSIKAFLPELLNSCSVGKKVYAVPVFGYATCLEYNKIAFKKYGLDTPSSSWTWQGKFYEACRKLTRDSNGDGAIDTHGFVGLPWEGFAPLFFSYGANFTDKSFRKVTYTEKPAMDAINLILKMHREKLAELVDWSEIDNEDIKTYPYNNGKSAMNMTWSISLDATDMNNYYKKNKLGIESGLAAVPAGPKGAVAAVASEVVTLMRTCKNKKEASEFIRFMAGAKGQELLYNLNSGLPTTEDGLRLKKVVKKIPAPFIKSYKAGKARHIRRQAWEVEGQLWQDMRNIVTSDGTMKDLIDNAKGHASEVISQVWAF